ncbi:MAG TPA: DUF3597 domain-containing protein [Thermoanaerobaculia bacterium]|nr:DUF3597 domain-containing protein [Thermoanaerobaculia bacterium]
MGMFGDLMGKIFHHAAVAERPFDAVPASGIPAGARHEATTPAPGAPATAVASSVDVAAILDKLASEHNGETLDWKHSIVDMMKLVGMDSSLTARKALAADLHYTGDTNDSATMNMWLHKEVLRKLAENGGKLPADLVSH